MNRVGVETHPTLSQQGREAEGRRCVDAHTEPESSPDNVASRRHRQTTAARKRDGKV